MCRTGRGPESGYLDLMVLHGDLTAMYNHIREADIAASTCTIWLWAAAIPSAASPETPITLPGCPRAADETGEKGILTNTVDKSG